MIGEVSHCSRHLDLKNSLQTKSDLTTSKLEEIRQMRIQERISRIFNSPPSLYCPDTIAIRSLEPLTINLENYGFKAASATNCSKPSVDYSKREISFSLGDFSNLAAFELEVVKNEGGLAVKVSKTYANEPPFLVSLPEQLLTSDEKIHEYFTNLRNQLKEIHTSDLQTWRSL
ncbi:MAG: hypothetical protein N2654_03380 [Deltaproteobacteria bacterium]|nr:hypothetical protein [Deltaproteobacteria bacterium]